jgi:hypothetical protein
MERINEADFGKKPKPIPVPSLKPKSFGKRDTAILGKIILMSAGYDRWDSYFDDNGLKRMKPKPLPPKIKFLHSVSPNAIRVYLEGYDYANK